MLLVVVSEMINMLIMKLCCSVIADFFGTSRKDKAVVGILCMFLHRTSRILKNLYCGIKELIDRSKCEKLIIFDGDGCIRGCFSVFYFNCFLYCDSSVQTNSKHFLFLYRSCDTKGEILFPEEENGLGDVSGGGVIKEEEDGSVSTLMVGGCNGRDGDNLGATIVHLWHLKFACSTGRVINFRSVGDAKMCV